MSVLKDLRQVGHMSKTQHIGKSISFPGDLFDYYKIEAEKHRSWSHAVIRDLREFHRIFDEVNATQIPGEQVSLYLIVREALQGRASAGKRVQTLLDQIAELEAELLLARQKSSGSGLKRGQKRLL